MTLQESPTGTDRDGDEDMLAAAEDHAPGWSTAYGGPSGVARMAADAEKRLRAQADAYAALRAAALARMTVDHSLAQIAADQGITRSVVAKTARKAAHGWAAELADDLTGKCW